MDTNDILTRAIRERRPVTAWYDGVRRVFCPHALGTKGRQRHVLAYQFAGGSTSSLPPEGEWRCFDVAKLADAALHEGPWFTAPNLFNPQSCLDEIELVVQPLPPVTKSEPRPADDDETAANDAAPTQEHAAGR